MEIKFVCVEPLRLRVDNLAAVKQIEGEKASTKSKHVDVQINFARCGILKPEYWEGERMPADLMTKGLAAPRICELRKPAGLQ
ncbi:polyprotein [Phytophthora megakarya]|uniref:Polyprotein n=1 Tax=Phytophthora megakarya TaxID=4795 RepID=A0A225V2N8_9STRA|nr:polyprotein [Phytophthora megakarya]